MLQGVSQLYKAPQDYGLPPNTELVMPHGFNFQKLEFDVDALRERALASTSNSLGNVDTSPKAMRPQDAKPGFNGRYHTEDNGMHPVMDSPGDQVSNQQAPSRFVQ